MSVRPLREVLAEVPDPRARGGRRYELEAILLLICAAMLCGCKNPNQIAAWGAGQSREYLKLLGFKRGVSIRKSALYDVLSKIDVEDLEKRLHSWVESVVAEMKAEGLTLVSRSSASEEDVLHGAIAIDGKTLRGSKKQGAKVSHLLSAVDQETGMTLLQISVDGKTNEIPMAEVLLQRLMLEGRVCTSDALLTQRAIAKAIVQKGGPTS